MSAPSEAKPREARWTLERARRSPGPKGASTSDGGGRHLALSTNADGSEAARRRAIDARPTLGGNMEHKRSKEAEE